jgi:uncharacterized protein (DUF433 family)
MASGLAEWDAAAYDGHSRVPMRTEIAPRIVVDDAVCHGRPVISGTRVPVEIVLGALAAGETIESVCGSYALEREDVLAALSYAAQTVAETEVRALP